MPVLLHLLLDIVVPNPFVPVPIAYHGEIIYVRPTNNSLSIVFGGANVLLGANNYSDGAVNTTTTTTIVSQLGPGDYAAYLCDTLNAYGYDDWYLPSKSELVAF